MEVVMELRENMRDISDEKVSDNVMQFVRNVTNSNQAIQSQIVASNNALHAELVANNKALHTEIVANSKLVFDKIGNQVSAYRSENMESIGKIDLRLGKIERVHKWLPQAHTIVLYVLVFMLMALNYALMQKGKMIMEREDRIEQILKEKLNIVFQNGDYYYDNDLTNNNKNEDSK
jgi:hypothetical protein